MTRVHSIPVSDWPHADLEAWIAACKPPIRLKSGGRVGHLKASTRSTLVRVYGQFLDHCRLAGKFKASAPAAGNVTPKLVETFITRLETRIGSVTIASYLWRLSHLAKILNPNGDWSWLSEIYLERHDRMRPRSLTHRLVHSNRLYRLGLSLMREAETLKHLCPRWRATCYRNGLLVALLAAHPIRLANLHGLVIGQNLRREETGWWIVLSAAETKGGRPDEKPLGAELSSTIDRWIEHWRPLFYPTDGSMWPSPQGGALAYTYVGSIITETTRKAFGIPVNPHLFRSCLVETLASYRPDQIGLATSILQHTDSRTTQFYYNKGAARLAVSRYHATLKQIESCSNEPEC